MNRTNSFGPDPLLVAFWAAICGAPAFLGAWLLFKVPTNESLTQFVWLLAFPLLPVVFASRFRVFFAPNEFVYRRWGPTVRVAYENIDRIEVTNVTPVSGQPRSSTGTNRASRSSQAQRTASRQRKRPIEAWALLQLFSAMLGSHSR